MTKRRVVITGMGVLAPNGKTLEEFWNNNINGVSGVDYITRFNTQGYDIKIAAEVKDFDPSKYMLPRYYRKLDRFGQLGVAAAKMAIDDAGLTISQTNSDRIGVIIGSGLGGIQFHEEQIMEAVQGGGPKVIMASCVPRISPNSVPSYISIVFGVRGPNYGISTACSSGANAIGQAALMIRFGMIDVCICGGTEAPITPFTFAAYQNLGALSRRNSVPAKASCPFDKRRDGFVMGEEAGVLVLESLGFAKRRRARIYAELSGFASNSGAYSMITPQPEGLDAAYVLEKALGDANIEKREVDYINAHGTSTPLNDIAETKALKKVFLKRAYHIPISSTKSMIGHTIGAAGAIEAIVSVLCIQNGKIPPTINLEHPDPECDLDYVPNVAREKRVDAVVSNSFGFGSNNAVLVFKKYA